MDKLKLRVSLGLADRLSAPLKRIGQSSVNLSDKVKDAQGQLRKLDEVQRNINGFKSVAKGLDATQAKLQAANATVKQLTDAYGTMGPYTKDMAKKMGAALLQVEKVSAEFNNQKKNLNYLQTQLQGAGVDTQKLAAEESNLKAKMQAVTAGIQKQTDALKKQAQQEQRLLKLKEQAKRAAVVGGGMAAVGAASMLAGRQALRPIQSMAGAFAEQEEASTQLKASMMLADGTVSSQFAKIDALAKSLGDRLPGTTRDFIEMMATLKQQGLTEGTILGGTGEAAALLAVQLKMPATAAAEFAAKMQDATRTSERDMLGLMDVIQRGYYLGMGDHSMLQGFSKISPVMSILRKDGLEFSKMMAPLLIMMDQTGMAGESAGNALRKVFQGGLDLKKLQKANELLGNSRAGFKLNFTDKRGAFVGMDNVFTQLEKLKGLGDNAVLRTAVLKTLFGDDSETMQVLNTMMDKGRQGYEEIIAKMQAQADLRQRVDQQLQTLNAVKEAAQGTGTNLLADIGEILAPDLKKLVNLISEVGSSVRGWMAENKGLVRWVGLGVLGLSAFMTVLGALLIPLGLLVAKGMAIRFIFAKVAALFVGSGGAMGLLATGMSKAVAGFGFLLRWGTALFRLNPFAALAAAVFGFADSFIGNWQRIKSAFSAGDWAGIGGYIIQGIEAGLNMATLGLYGILKSVLGGLITAAKAVLGINSPSRVFAEMGGFLIDGLIGGITSKLGALRDAVVNAASSAAQWFREKLGINSPSRLFMQYGSWVSEGAALGIQKGQHLTAAAAVGLAAATAAPVATASTGLRPIASTSSPSMAAAASSTYNITIHAAPGMDAQVIADAVRLEIDRRDRAARSRVFSQMSDTE